MFWKAFVAAKAAKKAMAKKDTPTQASLKMTRAEKAEKAEKLKGMIK